MLNYYNTQNSRNYLCKRHSLIKELIRITSEKILREEKKTSMMMMAMIMMIRNRKDNLNWNNKIRIQ